MTTFEQVGDGLHLLLIPLLLQFLPSLLALITSLLLRSTHTTLPDVTDSTFDFLILFSLSLALRLFPPLNAPKPLAFLLPGSSQAPASLEPFPPLVLLLQTPNALPFLVHLPLSPNFAPHPSHLQSPRNPFLNVPTSSPQSRPSRPRAHLHLVRPPSRVSPLFLSAQGQGKLLLRE